ncbi:MAG: hypothetical protein K6T49_07730 [Acidobacterium ailaaui]|nr:hypothetical protein [Pseudacidobacterium ailaaui]
MEREVVKKCWWIARRLLWQNRWLFLLLTLWPSVMAALLLAGGSPDPDDVLWMLHQECFAGLALVAVTGSTLLGNEQRSRRILTVLSRAVSRPMYLLAMLLAAWFPLVLYAGVFLLSGTVLADSVHSGGRGVVWMAGMQVLLGLWVGAISIFWSVLLPQLIASLASVATVAAATYAIRLGLPGPEMLLVGLFQITIPGGHLPHSIRLATGTTLAAAAVWFAAASWIFRCRDLRTVTD